MGRAFVKVVDDAPSPLLERAVSAAPNRVHAARREAHQRGHRRPGRATCCGLNRRGRVRRPPRSSLLAVPAREHAGRHT
jgi:hypothetical protein